MARSLKVSFEGLCGFVVRSNAVEVYLLSGHGDHGQLLLIRSEFLDVPRTTWMPALVGIVDLKNGAAQPDVTQVAIFSLKQAEATFADGSGAPVWQDKHKVIDFKTEHAASSTLSKEEIRQMDGYVGIISLVGSGTRLTPKAPGINDNFELKKNNQPHKAGGFSRIVTWEVSSNGVPTIKNADGTRIVLRGDLNSWSAAVCNVAPVNAAEGLTHFKHYYEGVKIQPAPNDFQMTIHQQFADVYDCVPPVAWP
jgi:hypothetical protein